jgi:hypothetical protein
MRTIQIKVSDPDLQKYNLVSGQEIKFTDLGKNISLQFAKQALLDCNEIAQKVGLSEMSLEEKNCFIHKAYPDCITNPKNAFLNPLVQSFAILLCG